MCLAIPGKVDRIYEENGLSMGRINYSGTIKEACLAYLPEVGLGQYVVVHAGFAISQLDEEEALQTLEIWGKMVESASENGVDPFPPPLIDDDGDAL